jgi:AcrR family transcriptional regulator
MQCEPDHPKGCLVSLGLMSACSEESKAISEPLAQARNLNRAGLVACIDRAIAAGELPATVIPQTLAATFDSFLLGLSTLARDGVPHATLDAAVTQMMGLWDSSRIVADAQ